MNSMKTSNDEAMVNTRPLFSSAWLALFSVLRQHYHGEKVVSPTRAERLRVTRRKNPGLKFNSV